MKRIITALLAATLVTTVAACEDGKSTKQTSTTAKKSTKKPKAKATIEDDDQATLPDLTALSHQEAQDTAQAIGFYNLTEKDATGDGRLIVWDRNWVVCEQDPMPGLYDTDREVTLYSVKVGEVCL